MREEEGVRERARERGRSRESKFLLEIHAQVIVLKEDGKKLDSCTGGDNLVRALS